MKIEVAIEGREPYGHPLNKEKTVIGSGDESDLVLKIKGISRKHAIVVMEDDHYYVVDQGSAGGTYINEEQLVPGQRAEFTSFFPVRLGEFVTLSLLSDEDETKTFEFGKTLPAERSKESQTVRAADHSLAAAPAPAKRVVISPAKTSAKGIEGREGVHSRKRTKLAPSKPAGESLLKRMSKSIAFGALIVVGGTFFFFYHKEGEEIPTAEVVPEVATLATAKAPEVGLESIELKETLPPWDNISAQRGCATTLESDLCAKVQLPSSSSPGGGLVVGPTFAILYIPPARASVLWQKLRLQLFLNDESKALWKDEPIDPRDEAALYLLALRESNWDFLSDVHEWVYAVVLGPEGEVGKVYFSEAQGLKKNLLSAQPAIGMALIAEGPTGVAPISGGFRLLEE